MLLLFISSGHFQDASHRCLSPTQHAQVPMSSPSHPDPCIQQTTHESLPQALPLHSAETFCVTAQGKEGGASPGTCKTLCTVDQEGKKTGVWAGTGHSVFLGPVGEHWSQFTRDQGHRISWAPAEPTPKPTTAMCKLVSLPQPSRKEAPVPLLTMPKGPLWQGDAL